jgi:uncharacterized Zn finger protein
MSGGPQKTPDKTAPTWWSEHFLQPLETAALGNRLTRGRTAARRGAVLALEVTAGAALARVRGAREEAHAVRLGLRPCSELAWARIEIALAESALVCARLLSGEVPRELLTVFTEAGTTLFPRSPGDLEMSCDCRDGDMPCEHVAATAYHFADAIEADPFLLLCWRGRERPALLRRLRQLRSDVDEGELAASVSVPPRDAGPASGTARALRNLPAPVDADTVTRFWVSPVPLPDRPAVIEAPAGTILRQLAAPGAVLGGPGLLQRLELAYDSFGADR